MSDRPIALDVIPENIPAELRTLPIWCCWRYEWNEKRQKWEKIPYTPYSLKHASSARPSSCTSFQRAIACYQERRDFFDGVFALLQADDPYTGGDFDHTQKTDRVPDTYAELSPSANGVRFIGRGTIPAACKKPAGELYNQKRFLSFTGHKLPGAPADIRPIQPALDALYEELKGSARQVREGTAGDGSRAELVKQIPESEWEAGRQELRTNIHRNVARVRAAAKEETQLACLLRGDYAGFHARWPFVGLYRSDGSLDESQVRAVVANGIRGRGFTFPEYAAVMTHLFGAAALAKWGTKEAWRQELAALWFKAQEPRRAYMPAAPRPKVKRGRAGNHADLVERIYCLLEEHRAGADAIVKIGDLAATIGANRRTVSTILVELRDAGRISWRRLGQYGGLVISFSDVIYSAAPEAVSPQPDAADAPPPAAAEETRDHASCVSSETAPADHISEPAHSGAEPPTLPALAAEYLSTPATAIGQRCVNRHTGHVVYRRSGPHFADLVAPYGYERDEAIEAYQAERERQKLLALAEWKRFYRRLDAMPDDELLAYVGGRLRADVAALGREDGVFDRHLYQTRLRKAREALAKRGLVLPSRKTKTTPYQPRPKVSTADGLIANLFKLRDQRTAQQPLFAAAGG